MKAVAWSSVLLVLAALACGKAPAPSPATSMAFRVVAPDPAPPDTCPLALALGLALLASPMPPMPDGVATLSLETTCGSKDLEEGIRVALLLTLVVPNEPDLEMDALADHPNLSLPAEGPEWERALPLARVIREALEDVQAQYQVVRLSEQKVAEWLGRDPPPARGVLFALLERAGPGTERTLRTLARKDDVEVALRAVGALSRIASQEAIAALGQVGVEAPLEVADAAVRALGELPTEASSKALEIVAGQSPRAQVRMRALWYLGREADAPGD